MLCPAWRYYNRNYTVGDSALLSAFLPGHELQEHPQRSSPVCAGEDAGGTSHPQVGLAGQVGAGGALRAVTEL